jgi:hypothetical protein
MVLFVARQVRFEGGRLIAWRPESQVVRQSPDVVLVHLVVAHPVRSPAPDGHNVWVSVKHPRQQRQAAALNAQDENRPVDLDFIKRGRQSAVCPPGFVLPVGIDCDTEKCL